ncbi:hypothetical protein V6N13_098946 [Hibiscus sabdariffa]
MDKTSIIVVILGIISVTTGFGAEFTRVKLNERRDVVVVKNGRHICYYIKPGVFAGGAVFAGCTGNQNQKSFHIEMEPPTSIKKPLALHMLCYRTCWNQVGNA